MNYTDGIAIRCRYLDIRADWEVKRRAKGSFKVFGWHEPPESKPQRTLVHFHPTEEKSLGSAGSMVSFPVLSQTKPQAPLCKSVIML